jgi:sugar phosphate isomerase/epimerase
MKRNILKCISIVDDFILDEYKDNNIGVEIQDFTESNLSKDEIDTIVKKYKGLFQNFNNIKSLHGPFLDLKPASPDEDIRKLSYNKYLRTINIATELEMDYLIFHSQINPFLSEPFISDLNNRQSREFWVKIMGETQEYKGTILIENIFEESPKMLKEYMQTLNMDNIKVNLDIGHARLGKASLEEWISELKDYIAYIHLHWNNGTYDQHTEPTEGDMDQVKSLLNKYNINPVISLEHKVTDLKSTVDLLRK